MMWPSPQLTKPFLRKSSQRINKMPHVLLFMGPVLNEIQQFENLNLKKYGFPGTCAVVHFLEHFRDFGRLYGPRIH